MAKRSPFNTIVKSPKIIRVTAAIIESDDKILIAQRKLEDDIFGGLWEFPGGKIEDGEGHQECLKRELKEELNINAEIGELYSEYVYKYPHISYRLYFYGVNNYTGEFKYNAHDRLEWATPDQFDQYNFLPGDGPLLDTIKDSYA